MCIRWNWCIYSTITFVLYGGIAICNYTLNLEHFLEDLNSKFKIKISTNTKKFVGIELHRGKESRITLNQKTFVEQIINRYGMIMLSLLLRL